MIYRRIARRYAAALLRAASERQMLDQVGADLRAAHERIGSDPRLRRALEHPEIPFARKQRIVEAVGRDLSPLTLRLLGLLVKRGRQKCLPEVAEEYERMADEVRGIARVEVRSAVEVTPQQRQRLLRALARRTNKRVEVRWQVDEGLLAGLLVRVDDQVVDASARGRLDRLRELLAGVRYRGLGR